MVMIRMGRFAMVSAVALLTACAHAAERQGTPPPQRVVSPRVAELLAAVSPKYEPPAALVVTASPPTPAIPRVTPANKIVRLPVYIVREPKVPKTEEVLTRKVVEKIAMQRYLGEEDGLNRALSVITPVHLWRRIPILGKYPLVTFQTNEQRAMAIYEREKIAERWADLSGLLSPSLRPSSSPTGETPSESRP